MQLIIFVHHTTFVASNVGQVKPPPFAWSSNLKSYTDGVPPTSAYSYGRYCESYMVLVKVGQLPKRWCE